MNEKKIKYNLQFFSEKSESEEGGEVETETGEDTQESEQIEPSAFAEIISEKDKKIEQLQSEIKQLNKTNANLLLKISAKTESTLSTEDKIYGFMNPRKE